MRPHPLALLAVLAACSSAPPKTGAATQCSGQLTFIVNNRSNRDVDVLANVGGGAAQAIGTVRAGGNEELMLPKGATSAFTRFPSEGGSVAARGRVDTRYSCRP